MQKRKKENKEALLQNAISPTHCCARLVFLFTFQKEAKQEIQECRRRTKIRNRSETRPSSAQLESPSPADLPTSAGNSPSGQSLGLKPRSDEQDSSKPSKN